MFKQHNPIQTKSDSKAVLEVDHDAISWIDDLRIPNKASYLEANIQVSQLCVQPCSLKSKSTQNPL